MNEIISAHMRRIGSRGGKTRAKRLSKEALSAIGKMGGRPRKLDK